MILCLLELFTSCREDSSVNLIILKGSGRAFCAGGDVASLARNAIQGNWHSNAKYFREGFTLIYLMATNNKYQVSILNGIVMGGGAGFSIHGRFRVSTEKSLFSMPETELGYFPDVGASYFLSRLPGSFGEYLGLTGARLDGSEMLACGLATHFVPSKRLPMLEAALVKTDSSDQDVISSIINDFSEVPIIKERSILHRLKTIDKCFSLRTVEEIIAALEKLPTRCKDDWIFSAIESMQKSSPTSLKIFLRSIIEGRLEGVDKCLIREFRIVRHVLRGEISHDFVEGCKAMLMDKDKNPKWKPSKIELVSDEMVDRYFAKVKDDEVWGELELPVRSNLPKWAVAKL